MAQKLVDSAGFEFIAKGRFEYLEKNGAWLERKAGELCKGWFIDEGDEVVFIGSNARKACQYLTDYGVPF